MRLVACFALIPVALAGGSAISPASGQSLALGSPAGGPSDPPSPSGTGAVSGSGTSVSGTYMFDGGAGPSTTSYKLLQVLTGQVTIAQGGSATSLNEGASDGGYTLNQANFAITGGNVTDVIHSSLGAGTISGGNVGTIHATGISTSRLNISGGTIGTVTLDDGYYGLTGNVSGGTIQSMTVVAGTFNMSGGSIGSLTLKNGLIDHGMLAPVTTITGGSASAINVTGGFEEGAFVDTCNISGGTFGTLTDSYYGGYDLTGTGLTLTPASYITGTLTDGEVIDALYTNIDGLGFLKFNGVAAVPEASTTVSFGLLLALGLGGVVLAKRRGKVALA